SAARGTRISGCQRSSCTEA
ncbi:hypothetical protein B7R56_26510, partial [Pseudomonas savastanoi pv. retacarpa]